MFLSFVLSQSISWPVQTSLLYMLWRRLAACCQPVCPHGNSNRLFPSNRSNNNNSKHSNNNNSSNNNLILHHSATWCKSFLSFSSVLRLSFESGFKKAPPSVMMMMAPDIFLVKALKSTDNPLNTEILYYWPSQSACMISIPWPLYTSNSHSFLVNWSHQHLTISASS